MKSKVLLFLYLSSMVFVAHAYETEMIVAKDGSGDFTSIQAAILASKTFPWDDITIFVKNGVYREKVNVYAWNTRISIIGESKENTIITFDDYFDKINMGRNSTFHTYTLRVAGNDFTAANLTIQNTAGDVGQAVALHVEADRAAFYNVNLKGNQDTLYVAGEGHRIYFNNCYIEGTVDFIFGGGTAIFEGCTIKSLRSQTYVTAASTHEDQLYGLIFKNCNFIASDGVRNVYLGRPWRAHAKTVILNSLLASHVHPDGWNNWGDKNKEKTVFYAEGNNRGVGSKLDRRVNWSHRIVQQQQYHNNEIFRQWRPEAPTNLYSNNTAQ